MWRFLPSEASTESFVEVTFNIISPFTLRPWNITHGIPCKISNGFLALCLAVSLRAVIKHEEMLQFLNIIFPYFSGATSHYFSLAHSFWAMCFIVNTYAVIVHERRGVFKRPVKFHFMQSVFSWLGPAGIVLGCLFISPPGYRFVFADLLAAGTDSTQMAYFAFTLPMQVSLGVSLCLLWSIVWCLRKVVKLFLVTCLTFQCPVKHDTIGTKTRYGERAH